MTWITPQKSTQRAVSSQGVSGEMTLVTRRLAEFVQGRSSIASSVDVVMNPDLAPVRLQSLGRKGFANGFVTSIKTGCAQPWQSKGERLGLEAAEMDPERVSFRAQPFTLSWRIGGEKWTYTPDRIEALSSGRVICVEVKASRDAVRNSRSAEKYELAAQIIQEIGFGFGFEVASELVADGRAKRISRLMHYRRTPLFSDDLALVDHLSSGGETSFRFADLVTAYADEHNAFGKLAALLVRRVVGVDINHDIGPASVLVPIMGGSGHHA
jgi:hypothetical protein